METISINTWTLLRNAENDGLDMLINYTHLVPLDAETVEELTSGADTVVVHGWEVTDGDTGLDQMLFEPVRTSDLTELHLSVTDASGMDAPFLSTLFAPAVALAA